LATLLQLDIAVVDPDVGGVEAALVDGPLHTGAVQDLRCRGQRTGVVAQFSRCRGEQQVGGGQVARNLDTMLPRRVGKDVGQVFRRCRRAAPLPGRAIHQRQPLRDQASLEHAVARIAHQFGNVDAHRADGGAAPAQVARVVDQSLPLLHVGDGRLLDQAERAHQRRKGAGLTQVGAPEGLELEHRRVLGIARGDVELASLGAQPTTPARLHVQRGRETEIGREAAHRGIDARFVARLTLAVERGCARGRSAHSRTPRWLKRMPVAAREKPNHTACISLPKGNQVSNSSRHNRCTANGPRKSTSSRARIASEGPLMTAMPVKTGKKTTI
jgi:hypothetical protein